MDIEQYFNNHNNYNKDVMITKYNIYKDLIQHSAYMDFRELVIWWICNACQSFKLSNESRDLTVRLLDLYFCSILNDTTIIVDKRLVSFAATISIVSASKLIESYNYVSLGNFSDFDMNELLSFQMDYWLRMQFNIIYPNITPSGCIINLLHAWNCDNDTKEKLRNAAEIALKDFITITTSMLYAPNVVALCALTTAFTMHDMDCTEYLKNIPEIFFNDINTDNAALKASLNFEKCLEIFDSLRQVRLSKQRVYIGINNNLMNSNTNAINQNETFDDMNNLFFGETNSESDDEYDEEMLTTTITTTSLLDHMKFKEEHIKVI